VNFADAWEGLTGSQVGCPPDLMDKAISDVVIDSRTARRGVLFVALHGEKTDGHLFLKDAFDRGALAAIAEPAALTMGLDATFVPEEDMTLSTLPVTSEQRIASSEASFARQSAEKAPEGTQNAGRPFVFVVSNSLRGLQRLSGFWRARMPVTAIGITGSVGKTTTKETIANVLAQRFVTLRSEGNLNNEIGLPLTLLRLTPQDQRVVLEMGMYAVGEIAHLCHLAKPRIGVVTNVGPTHLERLGTIERIAQAKAELVQELPPADQGGIAILNADDPLVRGMAQLTRARVFSYGLDPTSDLWANEISSEGLEGIRFRLHYGRETLILRLPILGRHSVHTALGGAAVGLVEGLSWTEIIAGLQEARGQLRLLVVPGLKETTLIDDTYNASPASMLAALNLLEDIAQQPERETKPGSVEGTYSKTPRRIAVLGDMLELGSYEEEGHRLVGGRAAQVLGPASREHGKLVTVGHRARWIAEEALAAGMPPADIHVTATNMDAVAVLQGLIRAGDVVLVKGSRATGMDSIVDTLSRPRKYDAMVQADDREGSGRQPPRRNA
jgi:UDP-N-acetylmuramoyl-tripeptide--D-alanyl-D-alanine ligase